MGFHDNTLGFVNSDVEKCSKIHKLEIEILNKLYRKLKNDDNMDEMAGHGLKMFILNLRYSFIMN